jgi:hypothetical protein
MLPEALFNRKNGGLWRRQRWTGCAAVTGALLRHQGRSGASLSVLS